MSRAGAIEKLVDAISQTKRSGEYCAAGELGVADPGLSIVGVGQVKLPVRPAGLRALADASL